MAEDASDVCVPDCWGKPRCRHLSDTVRNKVRRTQPGWTTIRRRPMAHSWSGNSFLRWSITTCLTSHLDLRRSNRYFRVAPYGSNPSNGIHNYLLQPQMRSSEVSVILRMSPAEELGIQEFPSKPAIARDKDGNSGQKVWAQLPRLSPVIPLSTSLL